MRVLTVNVGSTSLKLSVLDDDDLLVTNDLPTTPIGWDEGELRALIDQYGTIDAVGHRIVHGGTTFVEPVVVDSPVRQQLETLVDLAPLHLPKSLDCLDRIGQLLPGTPAVACFDTAFHAHLPEAASTYALPAEWRTRWPLRRFGFHGLSHAWASGRAAELVHHSGADLRVVTCHLGAGASLAAVRGGTPADTTMGFTPLEGLVMATRSGTVDPGLVLWLEDHVGLPPGELSYALEHRSGLLGLAGDADMRSVLDREARGERDPALAIAVYLHRLRGAIAAMTAALGGLDVLVFTGGVGERAASLRARAVTGLDFLGLAIDEAANSSAQPDVDISAGRATATTLVVRAREDVQIAREVRRVLGPDGPAGSARR